MVPCVFSGVCGKRTDQVSIRARRALLGPRRGEGMASVLDGVRVIDFGQYIAGPLAGMLLADQGADVIRVDPPDGPMWDTPANATWNRGKRSIILNLKQPDDLAIATRLVESADVMIENFRPGVMDRLGIGPQAALRLNPRLIYCSMPGFASDDSRAQVRAFEGVVGAATATYRPHDPEANRPVYTAIPISSNYAAFQGVVSIVMALICMPAATVSGSTLRCPCSMPRFHPLVPVPCRSMIRPMSFVHRAVSGAVALNVRTVNGCNSGALEIRISGNSSRLPASPTGIRKDSLTSSVSCVILLCSPNICNGPASSLRRERPKNGKT